MHRLLVLVVLVMTACSDGPPKAQIRADIAKALPGRLTLACGLLGTDELTVRAVKVESVGADGTGIASADVTNQHRLFGNPPEDCTVKVVFRFDRAGDRWVLAELRGQQ